MSFGSARDISRMMQRSMAREVLLVDLSDVPFIDSSAAAALEEVITGLREMNDTVVLFGVRERVLETLDRSGVLRLLSEEQIKPDRITALRAARCVVAADVVANG